MDVSYPPLRHVKYLSLMATLYSKRSLLAHHPLCSSSFHMSLFSCSPCLDNQGFSTFARLFRHAGLLSCNLNPSCVSTYKTYTSYRAHIYRHHSRCKSRPPLQTIKVPCPPMIYASQQRMIPIHPCPLTMKGAILIPSWYPTLQGSSRLSNDDKREGYIFRGDIQRIYHFHHL